MPTALEVLTASSQLPATGTYTVADHLATTESFVYANPIGEILVEEEPVQEVVVEVVSTELQINLSPVGVDKLNCI